VMSVVLTSCTPRLWASLLRRNCQLHDAEVAYLGVQSGL